MRKSLDKPFFVCAVAATQCDSWGYPSAQPLAALDTVVHRNPRSKGLSLLTLHIEHANSPSGLMAKCRIRRFDGGVARKRVVGHPHTEALASVVFPDTILVNAPHGAFQVDYSATFEMDLQHCARITRRGAIMPQGVKMAGS